MKSKKLLFVFVSFFMFANILFAASNKEMPVVHTDADFVYLSPNDDGIQDTGVINMVTSIVLDYRAYDTMFETIVLFTATLAVVITLKSWKREG